MEIYNNLLFLQQYTMKLHLLMEKHGQNNFTILVSIGANNLLA